MTSPETSHVVTLARALVAETREEMVKADQKAGAVLSALIAALAALIAATSTGAVTPHRLGPFAATLFWAGCAAWVPALILLGLAVAPNTGTPQDRRAHYFGDTAMIPSVLALAEVVRMTDPLDRDLNQLAVLSRLTWAKYRHIRQGMSWSAVFLVLTSLGILLGPLG
ncbi:Pycsar system effector family protein [Streptacidiphilus sp. P02-A3a]|uniref:Pycsar system effector family protein n=1 Tax=Streptacidiphilus sp. P02-A3a TaxID=2704468 RepID=UPI0015FB427B|nr:Pycsar system effector family protein [Streptacidiphilus sp. P02-A3a]QMU73323.1 hypothetical protein GXP74_38955 [Streptacidiphilus sp. P02-A3a]